MSKIHRLHKIIRHCVDQTNAQKVVFIGKEADIRPYLTDDCIIRTGEDDLVGADVLVYLGEENSAQRADLVRTAQVVLVDESNSHDHNMSLEHGCHGEIHIGSHLGRQFCLDRAYPPFIVYTHVRIDDIYSFAGYDSEEASEKFSMVSCFFYDTTGEPETTTSTTSVPADEPTTTLAPVPPAVEPVADTTTTEPVNESDTTTEHATSSTIPPSISDDNVVVPTLEGTTTTTVEVGGSPETTTKDTVNDNTTTTGGDSGESNTTTPEPTTTTGQPEIQPEVTTTTETLRPVEEPPIETTTTQEPVDEPQADQPSNAVDTTGTAIPDEVGTTTTGTVEDATTTTTTIDPERQRALDLFDNKPLSKMTDEEKQLLKDQGLI